MTNKITAIDLFCGAGGLSLGLEDAGINIPYAIELDRFACETYRYNFPKTKLFERDIKSFSDEEIKKKFSGVDLVVGGPPCQGFSVAGPSQYGKIDDRNRLILEFIRVVSVLQPKIALIENVKGLMSGKLTHGVSILDVIKKNYDKIGYKVNIIVVQSADYGVPQWRERTFIIASKYESLLDIQLKKIFDNKVKPWRTVWEAISDLPQIDTGEYTLEGTKYKVKPLNDYQELMRNKSKGIFNHVSMKHSPRLIERFKHIPIGGSLVSVPPEHGQRNRNGNGLDVRKRFKMNNQRLDPKKVSTCVTASFQSNFVHPYLHRNLTAREGARLQSYPDRFIFKGPRTLMSKTLLIREGREDEIGLSQFNQIGNSVPPLLAREMGGMLIKNLEKNGYR